MDIGEKRNRKDEVEMKTKKEIEKELEVRLRKFLANFLPPMSEETKRNVDCDRGYVDALKWVLEKPKKNR